MLKSAAEQIGEAYIFDGNNCADCNRDILEAGLTDLGERKTVFGITHPFKEYGNFKQKNKGGQELVFFEKGTKVSDIEKISKKNLKDISKLQGASYYFPEIKNEKGEVTQQQGQYNFDDKGNLNKVQ